MKFKFILSLCLAGAAMSAFAQGYKDGVEYYKADRLTNAEELLNRNLNNADTDKATAYYYLGQIQLARYYSAKNNNVGNPATYRQEAKKLFEQGMAANPDNPFNYIGIGHIALIDGDSKTAEDNFKKAEKLDKKDAGIYAAVARAYYDVNPTIYAKQMDKTIAQGEKLVQKQALSGTPKWADNDQDFYMFMGDMAFDDANGDSKKVGDACNFYESAIRVNPAAAEGYIKYADKLFAIKRNGEALIQLRTLLQNNPQSALGQRELAERLYSDGDIAKGIEEYGKLIKNPNHFKSDEDRYMTLLYFVKDYPKGYSVASEILASNPDQFNARRFKYIFATLLERPDALQLAEDLLKMKSATNRFATGDYAMIADALAKANRKDEALQVLNAGITDYPNEPSMLKDLARAMYYDFDQNQKAADLMSEYAQKVGNEISATDLNLLSSYALAAAQSQTDDTLKDKYLTMSAEAITKAAPKFAQQYKYVSAKRLGDIARMRNNNEQALTEYQNALQLIESTGVTDANKADASTMYRFVGASLYKDKKHDAAQPYIQKYMQLNPDDAEMAKLLK